MGEQTDHEVADIMPWASAEACTGDIRVQLTTDGSYSGNSPYELAAPVTVDAYFTALGMVSPCLMMN